MTALLDHVEPHRAAREVAARRDVAAAWGLMTARERMLARRRAAVQQLASLAGGTALVLLVSVVVPTVEAWGTR